LVDLEFLELNVLGIYFSKGSNYGLILQGPLKIVLLLFETPASYFYLLSYYWEDLMQS